MGTGETIAAAERAKERRWRRSGDAPSSTGSVYHSAVKSEEGSEIGRHSSNARGGLDKLRDGGIAIFREEAVVAKCIQARARSTKVVWPGGLPLVATARADVDVLGCGVEDGDGLEEVGGGISCRCNLSGASCHLWRLHGFFQQGRGECRSGGGQKPEEDFRG